MDRNLSYEITVKGQERTNCLTLLYGNDWERESERDEMDIANEMLDEGATDKQQLRSFYGSLGLLFVASLAIVILLMIG